MNRKNVSRIALTIQIQALEGFRHEAEFHLKWNQRQAQAKTSRLAGTFFQPNLA